MKRVFALFIAAFIVIASGCSPAAKSSTGVWVNTEKIKGKTFNSIFIVVMTADISARSTIENDLAAAATARGFKAVKSIDVMPPSLSNPAAPVKEELVSKVKASGCNAVFVSSVLKKDEDVKYTPGTVAYSPMPYYTWSGNYFGYYNHYYPTVSTPGYYSKDKTYFMQSNLYDVASEEIMWSVQSEIFNPSSIQEFSKSYTSTMLKQLQKEGLLKK